MAKIVFYLPGGLQVEREVPDKPTPKPSGRPVPAFAPESVSEVKTQKTILEKAAEVVEEVVKPKTRRGRPKKSS